jgi:radical SAM protein with 4Fe4S-binding SPASM domain
MGSEPYVLEHIDIEVNHRCNLACCHCSARAVRRNSANELTVDEIKCILSQAKELRLRKVGLTGGEPLFDVEKLDSIAKFCIEDLNVPIHTHTNGTLVNEEMCTSGGILTLFESVSVTFLGGDARTHDYMTRTKGSFEKAFQGAEIIAKNELPLTCYYIPTHGICKGYKKLTDKLSDIGVKRIRAMALAPSGRARLIYGETAALEDELSQFEDDLLEAGSRLGIHMEAGYCSRLSMPSLAALPGHEECMSGKNRVHINSKGDVFPCTAASGVKELRLGNLRKNGFELEEIWSDSALIQLIRAVHKGDCPECENCLRKPKCHLGCTVNAIGTMSKHEQQVCPIAKKT